MMKSHLLLKNIIYSILLFSYAAIAQTLDSKIAAMGQMTLIIESQDNQLNLYDFGLNPAGLMLDQQRSWLRPFFQTDNFSGKFKRIYEPERSNDCHIAFEGVKVLDINQAFRGSVDYHDLILNDVYQAINRDPYAEHPFRLADKTTGNIHYWGPMVSALYSRHVYNQRLFWGASLDYQIETGLKDDFPEPRIIYRNIGIGTGIVYRTSDRLSIGSTLNYNHVQEFTEVVPPNDNELRTIIITKFRGENIGVERIGGMEQFTKTEWLRWGLQSCFQPFAFFESALLFYYQTQNVDATENRVRPVKDGTWQLQSYEIHWKNRLAIPAVPFRLGFSLDHIFCSDWAIHPDFDLLLGDDRVTGNQIGIGVAYTPNSLPFILGVEYHRRLIEKTKEDYVSRMFGAGNMNVDIMKIGAELTIMENWQIRAGYIFQTNEINPTLLSFSEFLPANKKQILTLGLGYSFKSTEVECCGNYGQQQPTGNQNNLKRDSLGAIVSMKFYRE